jgi:hypothetical protein
VVLVEVVLETVPMSMFLEGLEQLAKDLMVELVVLNRDQITTGLEEVGVVQDKMVQQAHLETLADREEMDFNRQ